MKKYELALHNLLQDLLEEGETIRLTALLYTRPLALLALLGPLASMGSRYFFAAATDRRLFLIRKKMGLFGIKDHPGAAIILPYCDITKVTSGGWLNQKRLEIHTTDGKSRTLRLNTVARIMSGQQRFAGELPALVAEGKTSPATARAACRQSVPAPAVTIMR